MKKRILTGDRPTGRLHLGHYVGSLVNRVRLQDEYDMYIMIADVQALTDNFETPEKVRSNVKELLLDYLSVGIDPERVTIFVQSLIPEIAELTVFFSNLVTVAQLQRNPTVKQEIADKGHIFKNGNVTFGFLGYPVSQSADILFCKAELVPVGEDQLPMIEQAREIAKRFNRLYGEVFPEPEAMLGDVARLMGLDGRKMSKSFNNAIYLSDSTEEVEKKIMAAKTDDKEGITFDMKARPEISNLIRYYQIATGKEVEEIEKEFAGETSFKVFKEALAKALNEFLDPIRQKRDTFAKNEGLLDKVLRNGSARAKEAAEDTMAEVRRAMKIDY
ncbi:MAG: tryptophan--tRNA ligase [Candidatus Paceibacterota bacterium]